MSRSGLRRCLTLVCMVCMFFIHCISRKAGSFFCVTIFHNLTYAPPVYSTHFTLVTQSDFTYTRRVDTYL